jgi:hypothetical protein
MVYKLNNKFDEKLLSAPYAILLVGTGNRESAKNLFDRTPSLFLAAPFEPEGKGSALGIRAAPVPFDRRTTPSLKDSHRQRNPGRPSQTRSQSAQAVRPVAIGGTVVAPPKKPRR